MSLRVGTQSAFTNALYFLRVPLVIGAIAFCRIGCRLIFCMVGITQPGVVCSWMDWWNDLGGLKCVDVDWTRNVKDTQGDLHSENQHGSNSGLAPFAQRGATNENRK
jgi:hypothetical protein